MHSEREIETTLYYVEIDHIEMNKLYYVETD